MVYHVPTMLANYGNLKHFSGQGKLGLIITHYTFLSNTCFIAGVEKNNEFKRHYFSSNKHDAPGEIIRSEARQEVLPP